MTAIRGPEDKAEIDAFILERADVVIDLGYVPDWTAKQRAAILDEFRKALRDLPLWAVKKGFADWVRTAVRRPTPGEIGILANRAMKPIVDEINYRARQAEMSAGSEARQLTDDQRLAGLRAMQAAGFTPKRLDAMRRNRMAINFEDAEAIAESPQRTHWTETVNPDGPEVRTLKASRDSNPLVQAAREAAKRSQKGTDA